MIVLKVVNLWLMKHRIRAHTHVCVSWDLTRGRIYCRRLTGELGGVEGDVSCNCYTGEVVWDEGGGACSWVGELEYFGGVATM
jgi:hypothetical protein